MVSASASAPSSKKTQSGASSGGGGETTADAPTSSSTSTNNIAVSINDFPVVRDACLKAMQLYPEKEAFDRFYLFCQTYHKGVSQGAALALALLYTRLFVAFSHRHQQTNQQSPPTPPRPAAAGATAAQSNDGNQKKPDGGGTVVDLTEVREDERAATGKSNKSTPRNNSSNKSKEGGTSAGKDDNNNNKMDVDEDEDDKEKDNKETAATKRGNKQQPQQPQARGDNNKSNEAVVVVQRSFEAHSTNVELSPKVSASIYRIANDLAAVHGLLPNSNNANGGGGGGGNPTTTNSSSVWTNWSVARICVTAHDFVGESLRLPKLRKAWKMALGNVTTSGSSGHSASSERDMFFIFCEKTTEWMAGRVVRLVETYQDFVVVWTKSVVSNSSDKKLAVYGGQQQGRRRQLLDLSRIEWEPEVPELEGATEKNKSKANKDGVEEDEDKDQTDKDDDKEDAKDDEDKGDEDDDKSSSSDAQQETRARATVWRLAIFHSLLQQQQQQQRIPTRRQRLISGAAAVALVMALQRLTKTLVAEKGESDEMQVDKVGDDEDNDKMQVDDEQEPSSAQTTNDELDVLMAAANKACAYTRWACLDTLKIAQNVTEKEIIHATKRLATSVFAFSKSKREQQEQDDESNEQQEGDPASKKIAALPQWIQDVHARVGQKPDTILFRLPTLAAELVDGFSRQLRKEKIKVEASFYYDETAIVTNEQHVHILCQFLDRPMTTTSTTAVTTTATSSLATGATAIATEDSDTRFTASAASRQQINNGMADQPGDVEEQQAAAKRRRLNEQQQQGGSNRYPPFLKSATPAVISEAMELTEWTVALLYLEQVKPSIKLRALLKAAGSPKDSPKQDWSNIVVPILNATLLRLSQEGLLAKTTRKAAVSVQTAKQAAADDGAGTVVMAGMGEVTHDKALCRALVAFYYHALECILTYESDRNIGYYFINHSSNTTKKTAETNDRIHALVMDKAFHRALLACCCICVIKAVGTTQKLRPSPDIQSIQIYQALLVCDSNPFDFLKVSSDRFLRSLAHAETASSDISIDANKKRLKKKGSSPFLLLLPRILKRDFQRCETNVLESLVWARDPKFGTSLATLVDEFVNERNKSNIKNSVTWWPVQALQPSLPEEVADLEAAAASSSTTVASKKPPTHDMEGHGDYKTLSHIIENVLRRSYQRIVALSAALDIPVASPLARQVWIALRYLMRKRVELFFDRHVDHWILSCFYGVAKQMKLDPEVKFTKIVDAYIAVRGPEMGDVTCQRIVRNIKIDSSNGGGEHQWGNVIALYNKMFVPVMKDYLQKTCKSLPLAAEEARRTITFKVDNPTPAAAAAPTAQAPAPETTPAPAPEATTTTSSG